MKIVSFDFDGTLTRQDVQDYAEELLRKGYKVIITTARTKVPVWLNARADWNADLYRISDKLGILREDIYFCDCQNKADFLPEGTLFHLDDDKIELELILDSNLNIGIDVKKDDWKKQCHYKLY